MLNKDVENIIEESNYQVRAEIAENCILHHATLEFVMEVCTLSKEEVTTIYNDLKKRNPSIKNNLKEKKHELNLQKLDVERVSKKELKYREKQKIEEHQEQRKRDAEIQRQIAAENTRLLMERIKTEQDNKKLLEIERINLREREALSKSKEHFKSIQLRKVTNLKKSPNENAEQDDLSAEQKMIASVGNCYLRGLDIKQTILFCKASKEDVERIYNSFKNK